MSDLPHASNEKIEEIAYASDEKIKEILSNGRQEGLVIAVTGHRPDKLFGYDYSHEGWCRLRERLKRHLSDLGASVAISGMALGVDTVFAQVALELKLPLICAIPCRGQHKVWQPESQSLYMDIVRQGHCKLVSDSEYTRSLMNLRNLWMVENCDKLLAVWDGSPGGTANCVILAKKKGKEIIYVELSDLMHLRNPKQNFKKRSRGHEYY